MGKILIENKVNLYDELPRSTNYSISSHESRKYSLKGDTFQLPSTCSYASRK